MEEADYSKFVPNVHFEQIPIKNLVANQEYQRNLSQNHIVRAAKNFDLYQINPVKVSRRNGINYVFNGQHTIEIVAMVSESRDTPVWCMVYDDMDYSVEADVFANQQKYVKALAPYEIYKANIEAGNDKQIMIKSLVESYGLTIGRTKGQGVICAVSSLEYIFDTWGFHVLDRALRLCIGTWEGAANSLSSNMLKGIARLIVAFDEKMRDDIFKEKVGAYSAKDIIRTAKERRAGAIGYAEAMLIAPSERIFHFLVVRNKKMKYPLRWSNLYSNPKVKKAVEAIEMDIMSTDEEADDMLTFF